MIYAMVVLGGVTRLTGSGLSMVEWDPLFGIVPPLGPDEWNEVFDLYKQSPEYNKINIGMDVDGFKRIYWYEFAHRLLGRSIGVVFFVPLLIFLATGRIRRGLTPKLIVLFVLGGLQGLLGWYMVKSGLVDNPHVSQYRLTAHLALAVVIYAYMFWLALDLVTDSNRDGGPATPGGLRLLTGLVGGLVFITMLSGGFVAGLKAGFAYNTFPLMAGRWIPDDLFIQAPLWRNFFENVTTVQFDHRVLAIVTFAAIVLLWLIASVRRLPALARTGLHLLLAAAILQVTLGIMTLLLRVPVVLGAAHQAGALLLLTASLYASYRMKNA
jgi:cytochrome c oxidase assembly protein subunit 15